MFGDAQEACLPGFGPQTRCAVRWAKACRQCCNFGFNNGRVEVSTHLAGDMIAGGAALANYDDWGCYNPPPHNLSPCIRVVSGVRGVTCRVWCETSSFGCSLVPSWGGDLSRLTALGRPASACGPHRATPALPVCGYS